MRAVRLRPFTSDDLALVEPWFADADSQRWLGGPGWPRLVLAGHPLGEYRGAAETGNYDWLATDDELVVGYIGCGTYDRWTTWEGGPGGRGVVAAIDVPSANVSYVVDPACRRRGYCVAVIAALLARPELAHVELFAAGVEPANAGSVACLLTAGFRLADSEPDADGVVYYLHRRG